MEAVDGSDPLAPLQNQMGRMEAKEEDDEDEDEDEEGEDTDMDEWDPDPPRPFDPNDLCKQMKQYIVYLLLSFFFSSPFITLLVNWSKKSSDFSSNK